MVSCSDSNDYNSASNVTVAMQSAQIVTKESKGLFYVPIVVTGEPNGPIKVEVSVKGEGNTRYRGRELLHHFQDCQYPRR